MGQKRVCPSSLRKERKIAAADQSQENSRREKMGRITREVEGGSREKNRQNLADSFRLSAINEREGCV